jgi:hypothetical protein
LSNIGNDTSKAVEQKVAISAASAGLLMAELVARKAEDLERLIGETAVQRLQPGVLAGEAAFGRRVDDQQGLTAKPVEGDRLAVEALGAEVIDRGHIADLRPASSRDLRSAA